MSVLFTILLCGLPAAEVRLQSEEIRLVGAVESRRPFLALGVYAASDVRVRASGDGVHWTQWRDVHPDPDGSLVYFGEPLRFIESDSALPLRVLAIDPGESPRLKLAPRAAGEDPPVVNRADWGCTPQTCPVQAAPSFTTVTHLVVHHSAGANTPADWAAVVRSIWVLHVRGNGWNDIGYNYLIDPNGVLYEGRAGGDGVLGAHFSGVNGGTMGVCLIGTFSSLAPRAEAVDTLSRMLAVQARRWKIDPAGRGVHASSRLLLNNISGHRDAGLSPQASGTTECPGNGLYALLPRLRAEVRSDVEGECPVEIARPQVCAASSGGSLPVAIGAPEGCALTVQSRSEWIEVSNESGAWSLMVRANTGAARSGTVAVNGQRVDVSQSGSGANSPPCIDFRGVVNSVSFDDRPLAPGSLFTIFGADLADSEGRTSVTINNARAAVLYAGAGQINALMPAVNIGSARLAVNRDGLVNAERLIWITESSPAIFAAVIEEPGTLSVYYTGAGRGNVTPSARIGDAAAALVSNESAPELPGVMRAVFRVAPSITGDASVRITMAGVTSNAVNVSF